jgi:hypothetical protein
MGRAFWASSVEIGDNLGVSASLTARPLASELREPAFIDEQIRDSAGIGNGMLNGVAGNTNGNANAGDFTTMSFGFSASVFCRCAECDNACRSFDTYRYWGVAGWVIHNP